MGHKISFTVVGSIAAFGLGWYTYREARKSLYEAKERAKTAALKAVTGAALCLTVVVYVQHKFAQIRTSKAAK